MNVRRAQPIRAGALYSVRASVVGDNASLWYSRILLSMMLPPIRCLYNLAAMVARFNETKVAAEVLAKRMKMIYRIFRYPDERTSG